MEREHTKLSAHTPPVGQAGEAVFTFAALPGDLVAMQALPEAALQTPAQTAALTVLALCAYAKDPEAGIAMLDWLRGPRPLTGMDRSFLRDRFRDGKSYLPFTYLEGATPENGYTPSQPFRIRVVANATSAAEAGYQKLFLPCGGADDPRPIKLRRKGNGQWFLWEQYLLTGIRVPTSADPWA